MHNIVKTLKIIFNMRLSLYKRYNFLLQMLERYLFRRVRLASRPYRYFIEPSTYCSLRCVKCVQAEKNDRFKKGFLSYEDSTTIFEKIKRYAIVISFTNWGEPFLNKEIFKMIKTCKENNIFVELSSNLNFTNTKIAEEIVRSGLDRLVVSIDGASQESYGKYRVRGKIDRVFDNIRLIQEHKKAVGSRCPKIEWQFLVNRYNEHEIEDAKDRTRNLGIDIRFARLRPTTHKEVFMSDEEKYQDLLEWFPQYSEVSYKKVLKSGKPRTCALPWISGVINFDGGVYPCCSLMEEKYYFGNLLQEGFEEIWNNELFINARRIILGKETERKDLVCITCKENNFTLS